MSPVAVKSGGLWGLIRNGVNADAMTLFNSINIDEDLNYYNFSKTMSHEVMHVIQWQAFGASYYQGYVGWWANGGNLLDVGYQWNPYEIAARAFAATYGGP
jgi:hypothetical protein